MPWYRVTFRGGGPTLASNLKAVKALEASDPHVAVSKAMRQVEEAKELRLPKGAWVHLTVSRVE